MDVYTEISPLRESLAPHRGRRPVVLVPTMGALHDGHRACIDAARALEDALVVVSIFVNPLQFNVAADLERYPRPLERDREACRNWGVGAVFAPSAEAMYPDGQHAWVEVDDVAAPLEGEHRPGHFRGVTTVVAKLFNIVMPDVAVFGQKDAQQALVIRRMVSQLDMPVALRLARTVREHDGLALSSRNARLDAGARARAAALFAALEHAGALMAGGERDPATVESAVVERLEGRGIDRVDYAALRRAGDLSPLERLEGRVILALAAHLGDARLIDNMVYEIAGDRVSVDVDLF